MIYTGVFDQCNNAESIRLYQRVAEGDQAAAAKLEALDKECTGDMASQHLASTQPSSDVIEREQREEYTTSRWNTIPPLVGTEEASINEKNSYDIRLSDDYSFDLYHFEKGEKYGKFKKKLFQGVALQNLSSKRNYFLKLYKKEELNNTNSKSFLNIKNSVFEWRELNNPDLSKYKVVVIIPGTDGVYKITYVDEIASKVFLKDFDPKWFQDEENRGLNSSLLEKIVDIAAKVDTIDFIQYFDNCQKAAMLIKINGEEELYAVSALIQKDLLGSDSTKDYVVNKIKENNSIPQVYIDIHFKTEK